MCPKKPTYQEYIDRKKEKVIFTLMYSKLVISYPIEAKFAAEMPGANIPNLEKMPKIQVIKVLFEVLHLSSSFHRLCKLSQKMLKLKLGSWQT